MPTTSSSLLIAALFCSALQGCVQATPEIASDPPAPQPAPPTPSPGVANDTHAVQQPLALPPDAWHGNWRLLAADDGHRQALMAFSIQSSKGEASGSGDYILLQPFCDAVANAPISGTADCELIGVGGTFDRIEASSTQLLLTLHPTADGMEHRLELRHEGERLVGHYIFEGNDIHRPIIAEYSPVQ